MQQVALGASLKIWVLSTSLSTSGKVWGQGWGRVSGGLKREGNGGEG
jgi:hypothetical protein